MVKENSMEELDRSTLIDYTYGIVFHDCASVQKQLGLNNYELKCAVERVLNNVNNMILVEQAEKKIRNIAAQKKKEEEENKNEKVESEAG